MKIYSSRSSLSFVAENDFWVLKHSDGCLTNEVSWRKAKFFNYFMEGLLTGSFCKVERIKSFKDCDIVSVSGNVNIPDFIFL